MIRFHTTGFVPKGMIGPVGLGGTGCASRLRPCNRLQVLGPLASSQSPTPGRICMWWCTLIVIVAALLR